MDFKEVFKTNTNEFEEVMFQNKELNKLINVDKLRKKLSTESNIIMADQKLIFSILNISILLEEYSW